MVIRKTQVALAAALCSTCFGAFAGDFDFNGYFRSGTGVSTRGGSQVCFGLSGADSKFRLGNECDYVLEASLDAKVAEFEGAQWRVKAMVNNSYAWADSPTSKPDFGQFYAYGNKISQLRNGTVWAGKRFYNRIQTGINDQFLENNDGDGAGVEDMDLGFGKASFAFMQNPVTAEPNNVRFSLPIRLTDVKTYANGKLSVYLTPNMQTRSRDQVTNTATPKEYDGNALGVYQTLGGTFGGETLIGIRTDHKNRGSNNRIVVQQTAPLGARTQLDVLGEYRVRTDETTGVGSRWTALGARTDTHISGPFRFIAEIGQDRVSPDGADTQVLTKITLAGAISAGKESYSRPTIRLFVTHAIWNEAARQAILTSTDTWRGGNNLKQVYGDGTSGTSVGVQAEAWW